MGIRPLRLVLCYLKSTGMSSVSVAMLLWVDLFMWITIFLEEQTKKKPTKT